jgi:hypothetical protein
VEIPGTSALQLLSMTLFFAGHDVL